MKTRGTIGIDILIVTGVIAAGAMLVGQWKPSKWFEKGPPVEQLTKLQSDLDKAQANLREAQAREQAAADAERAKQTQQVRFAQQMQSGAQEALDRQPVEHRTEQTKLAVSLLNRSELALALAIGQLPPEQQAEILKIVDKALSSLASERDEAQRLLKEKDAELRTVTKERDAIKEELPKLAAQVEEAKAKAAAKTEEVKVAQVKLSTWATIKDKADRHASSLAGQVESLWNGFLWLAGAYVVIVFILPGIVKYLPSGALKTVLRDTSGFIANPLLHLDARRKLTELQKAAAK